VWTRVCALAMTAINLECKLRCGLVAKACSDRDRTVLFQCKIVDGQIPQFTNVFREFPLALKFLSLAPLFGLLNPRRARAQDLIICCAKLDKICHATKHFGEISALCSVGRSPRERLLRRCRMMQSHNFCIVTHPGSNPLVCVVGYPDR
jgi:hypothetical protein